MLKSVKKFEKFDLEMNSDYNKVRAHELKEDLHYVIDEKNQQADLTEIGRSLDQSKRPRWVCYSRFGYNLC